MELKKFPPENNGREIREKPTFRIDHPSQPIYLKNKYSDILNSTTGIFTLGNPTGQHYLLKPQLFNQIFFLGFGYDLENLWRLGFNGQEVSAKIYGTAFGMTQLEIQEIVERLARLSGDPFLNTQARFKIEAKDSYVLLRERLLL